MAKFFGGLLVLAWIVAGSIPARAAFIDHQAGCRQWEAIAQRVYANYQTTYKTIWAAARSQAREEEARARAQGWDEDSIKHLLLIISNAASGQWTSMEQIGTYEFDKCIAVWKSISTPEERAAELKEIQTRQAAATETREKTLENIGRTTACQEYQSMAIQLIGLQQSGATYKYAAEWAAAKAYGPGGQVLRYSEDNANHFMALAAAVYFARDKYGKTNQAFMASAFNGCMRGELLDASQN